MLNEKQISDFIKKDYKDELDKQNENLRKDIARSLTNSRNGVIPKKTEPQKEAAVPEKHTKRELSQIREKCREILKKTDSEITEDDKKILSQYEGAGGLNEENRSVNGVLNEFYTPKNLVDKVWKIVDHYAPDAKTVLEPSAGIGKFAANRSQNKFTMHELDETSARIAKILHPDANVIQGAYQKQFFDEGGRVRKTDFEQPKYDVVIGNPPYGKYNDKYKGLGEGKEFDRYEEYFISKGLDALKDEKSVLAFVVPSGFLKSANDSQKKIIAQKGELIDAYRLPEGTFGTTDVGTDILVMRNWEARKQKLNKLELQSRMAKEAFNISDNQWFKNHPEKILGKTVEFTDRFGKPATKVVAEEGMTVQDELDKIDAFVADEAEKAEQKKSENQQEQNLQSLNLPKNTVDLTDVFDGKLKNQAEIAKYIKSISDEVFVTYDNYKIGILPKDSKHIVYTNGTPYRSQKIRMNNYLVNLEKVLKNAKLKGISDAKDKKDVKEFYYFEVPVKVGDGLYMVQFDCKKNSDVVIAKEHSSNKLTDNNTAEINPKEILEINQVDCFLYNLKERVITRNLSHEQHKEQNQNPSWSSIAERAEGKGWSDNENADYNNARNQIAEKAEKKIEQDSSEKIAERIEQNPQQQATNFVLEKLKAAGIEVVADKDEFERILNSTNRIQKMTEKFVGGKIKLAIQEEDGRFYGDFYGNETEEQLEKTYRIDEATIHHRENWYGGWWYEGPYLSIYESYGDVAPGSTAGHNILLTFEPADYRYNESKKDRFLNKKSQIEYIYSGTKSFDRIIDVFKQELSKEDFEKYFGKFVEVENDRPKEENTTVPRANVLSNDLKGFKEIADRICAIDESAQKRLGYYKIKKDAKAAEEYFSFLKSRIVSVNRLSTSVFNELENRNRHTAVAALSIMGYFGEETQKYFAERSVRNKDNPDNYDFPPEVVNAELKESKSKKNAPRYHTENILQLNRSMEQENTLRYHTANILQLNRSIGQYQDNFSGEESQAALKKLDGYLSEIQKSEQTVKADDFLKSIQGIMHIDEEKSKTVRHFVGEKESNLRISNHSANAVHAKFRPNETSVVIRLSSTKFRTDKNSYLAEYVYNSKDLTKEKQAGIINGLKDWINTGDFTDKHFDREFYSPSKEEYLRYLNEAQNPLQKMSLSSDRENVYGFAYDGKIYLNPDFLTSNVAVHEYTHLWDEYTRRTNPELWQKGMNIFKNTKYFNEVKSDPNYADIADDDNLVLSEVHARICGKMAEKVLERIAKEDGELTKDKAIDWNEECATYLLDFVKEANPENEFIQEMEVSDIRKDIVEFFAMPMKDLMNGKNISLTQENTAQISPEEKISNDKPEVNRAASAEIKNPSSEIDGDNKSLREYEDKNGLFKERKILSMQEFSKFYTGENFSPAEYNIWAATDYKGFIDTQKLTEKEFDYIKKSEKYVEPEKGKYQNALLFASGNIYDKLDELESRKDTLSAESYEKCRAALEKAKPEPLKMSEIQLDALSPLAEEFKVTRTLETYTGIGENTETQEVEVKLRDDFINWATGSGAGQNPDSDNYAHNISNWAEANVRREEFPEGIYWRDITDYIERIPVKTGISKDDTKDEQQRKEVAAGAKQDARKETAWNLFNRYLQEGLGENDKKRFAEFYNRINNGKREVDYKKLPLFISGMSTFKGKDPFILYKQQVEGVSRLVAKGNGLLAYGVGVGKTAAGIVATAAQLESGRSRKPLIIVPNQVYTKWVNDFEELFPNIKVNRLGNLSDEYLKNFGYSRLDHSIKIPDGTVSVMMESALGKITFSDDAITELSDEFGSVLGKTEELHSANDRDRAEARNKVSELIGKASQVRETKLPSGKTQRQENQYVFIDKIGFDNICIDEAHRYKNLYTVPTPKKSSRGKPEAMEFKGIGNGGKTSKRALKIFGMCSLVQKHNDNRNVFLLTATPFTNNPLEVYSMLSLMARKELIDRHIYDVRDFCTEFAKTKFEYAVTPDGGIKPRAVMKAFKGKQKLRSLINEFIDQKSPEDAGIPRPEGERHPVLLEMTPLQAQIMAINEKKIASPDKDDKGAILKAMVDMRTCALSPALLNPEDYPTLELPSKEQIVECSPKLKFVCDTVADVWKKKKECGQFIYMPQGVDYMDEVKSYLVTKGVPADCIEYVSGKHKSKPEEKQEVADCFNDKKDRLKILIGGSNLAEGIDLNGNSIACYNTMLGWNPTETVQVEGRVWRQGNEQGKVHIFYPLLEDSIDAVMYQKYDEKSSRINDVFRDDGSGKDTIDVSEIDPEKLKFDLIKDPRKKIDMLIDQETSEYKKEINVLESRSETISEYLDTFTEQSRAKKMAEAERNRAAENVKKWREELKENPMNYSVQLSLDSAVRTRENAKKEEQKAAARLACVSANFERMGIKNPDTEVPEKMAEINSKIEGLNAKIKEIEESKEERIASEQKKALEKKLLAKPLSETEKDTVKNILEDTWYAKTKPERTKLAKPAEKKETERTAAEITLQSKPSVPVDKAEKRGSAESVSRQAKTSEKPAAKKIEKAAKPSAVQDFGGYLFDMDEALKSKKLDRASFKNFGNKILTAKALRAYKGLPPFIVDKSGEIKMRVFGKDLADARITGYIGKEAVYPGDIVDIKVSIGDLRGFVERYVSERKMEEMENSLGNPVYKKRAVILPRLQMTDSLAKFAKDYDVSLSDMAGFKNVYNEVMTGGDNPILPPKKPAAKSNPARKIAARNLPDKENSFGLEIG